MAGSQAPPPGRPWAAGSPACVPAQSMPQMWMLLSQPWMMPWTTGDRLQPAVQQEVSNFIIYILLSNSIVTLYA